MNKYNEWFEAFALAENGEEFGNLKFRTAEQAEAYGTSLRRVNPDCEIWVREMINGISEGEWRV